jgi:hypothetical protein
VTVVEADVMAERRLHWMLVADRAPGPVVAINRPDMALAANPVRLVGDPSYVAGLARAALRRGVRPARLTAIELGHTYAWRVHRDVAARAFGVPIGVDYNTSELGSIAVTCRDGRLHLLEANALYEILDRGRAVTRAGAVGALVATTLDTALRPLLRYVVGDVVRFRASACTCGRPFRVIEYEGRLRDLIAARRGRCLLPRYGGARRRGPPRAGRERRTRDRRRRPVSGAGGGRARTALRASRARGMATVAARPAPGQARWPRRVATALPRRRAMTSSLASPTRAVVVPTLALAARTGHASRSYTFRSTSRPSFHGRLRRHRHRQGGMASR